MPKLSSAISGEDRFNLMISIAGYLIRQEGPVEIDQVAQVFDVDESAVRSALQTLNLASAKFEGRPEDLFFDLDHDLLDEGVISFIRNDSLEDAPKLSTRQASAISAGLQYLASIPDFASSEEIQELLNLLAQAHPSAETMAIEVKAGSPDSVALTVREAIRAGRAISCEYVNSRGERRERKIDPISLTSSGPYWYVFGFCHEQSEGRNFRLDRMRKPSILEQTISATAVAISAVERPTYIAQDSDIEVLIEVEPEAYRLIAESMTTTETSEVTGGRIRATIKVGHLANLGRIIARYGGAARVIEPEIARQAVRVYAEAVLENLALQTGRGD